MSIQRGNVAICLIVKDEHNIFENMKVRNIFEDIAVLRNTIDIVK